MPRRQPPTAEYLVEPRCLSWVTDVLAVMQILRATMDGRHDLPAVYRPKSDQLGQLCPYRRKGSSESGSGGPNAALVAEEVHNGVIARDVPAERLELW